MKHLTWGLLTLLTFSGSSLAAESSTSVYYVSPQGNDNWSGERPSATENSTDGPFATVPRALQAVRDWKQTGNRGGMILLRNGFYFLEQPIRLSSGDSGVTLAAYQDEKPVLSGGRRLTGWKEVAVSGRRAWAAPVPQLKDGQANFRELWLNDKRAVRARHPNTGYLSVAELPDRTPDWFTGHQRFRFAEGDLKNWPDIKDAEVVVMNRWVESRLPVRLVEESERLVSFGKRSVFQLAAGDPYYLEGAMEALDQPGEWCLDRTSGTVYYLPRPGERLAEIVAIAPVLHQVLRGEGHPEKGEFVDEFSFRNLTFSHTEWCFPSGFDSAKGKPEVEPSPKPEVGGFAQAAVGVPGAVSGEGLRQCVFERCSFASLGTYGLELARGCSSNRVLSCEFSDLGAGGIKIGETAIRGNAAEQASGNEISDCRIHDGGKMFHSAIGVWIGQSPNNRIRHNLIHDFFYTGISIGWTWGYGPALAANNLVAYNHIHHVGKKTDGDGPILSDMGGIYTLGMQPGTRIVNNLWHDIAGRQYGGWGIYLDEGSSSIIARSNVVYGTTHGGFHQHYGATNLVCNNIFAFARDHQVQRSRPEAHVSFSFLTNIIYFDQGVTLGGNWSNDQFRMDWNVYWDARPGAKNQEMQFAGQSLEQWRARGHDVHCLIADPLFVAPAQHDYRLRQNSPALSIGFQPIDLTSVGPRNKK